MGRNKYVDLFNDMIPAIDTNLKELWDAVDENGQKEIKNDLWILNRWISSAQSNNTELQKECVLAVNKYFNKNWNDIAKDPKLQWQTLCLCGNSSNKKSHRREWIALKTQSSKKEEFLSKLFPDKKVADIETLAKITTTKEIKEYCTNLGWDKKEVNGIKF
jgi:hypothetical protein